MKSILGAWLLPPLPQLVVKGCWIAGGEGIKSGWVFGGRAGVFPGITPFVPTSATRLCSVMPRWTRHLPSRATNAAELNRPIKLLLKGICWSPGTCSGFTRHKPTAVMQPGFGESLKRERGPKFWVWCCGAGSGGAAVMGWHERPSLATASSHGGQRQSWGRTDTKFPCEARNIFIAISISVRYYISFW